MKIIDPSFEVLYFPNDISLLETAGRTCYRSESKGDPEKFVAKIINSNHLSVIEHLSSTVKIITDRGVLAELSRHRLASFSVESTRYVNYNKKEIEFIKPCFFNENSKEYNMWFDTMKTIERVYCYLIESGSTPEQARSVLPMSLKTEIVITANFRSWLHIFKLRTAEQAHPEIRKIMIEIEKDFHSRCPVIF